VSGRGALTRIIVIQPGPASFEEARSESEPAESEESGIAQ
jgi:hypothetical protein